MGTKIKNGSINNLKRGVARKRSINKN